MTQADRVLDELRRSPVDVRDFAAGFRLAARIKDLRDAGHRITTTTLTLPGGAKVARYSLDIRQERQGTEGEIRTLDVRCGPTPQTRRSGEDTGPTRGGVTTASEGATSRLVIGPDRDPSPAPDGHSPTPTAPAPYAGVQEALL